MKYADKGSMTQSAELQEGGILGTHERQHWAPEKQGGP